jgi:hypothetical protein
LEGPTKVQQFSEYKAAKKSTVALQIKLTHFKSNTTDLFIITRRIVTTESGF